MPYSSSRRKKEIPSGVIRLLELIFDEDFDDDQRFAYQYYKKLNSKIRILSEDDYEHDMIWKYIRNTHGPTHDFRLSLKMIFTITRRGEYENYKSKKGLGNRKLLWHGTKLSNYYSILERGLMTQPPRYVDTNGKMFGDGIYFTDIVTKAAQYCKPSKRFPYGILILAEVALGKHYYRTSSADVKELRYGKSSVKGLGKYKPRKCETIRGKHDVQIPLGRLEYQHDLDTDLDYSEYIIYNSKQIFIKYLVLVKFHFD